MRSTTLDRRVRREARLLVKEARSTLRLDKKLRGKADELAAATTVVEKALDAKDNKALRHGLPTLDLLVDELVKRPKKSTTRNYVESIGGAILIALALRAFVVEAFKIPSSSMYPTLEIGDHIFVNKFLYGLGIPYTKTKLFDFRDPHRGEVIVFEQPCEKRDFIKRVIGLPGDTIEVRCDVVWVNGKPLPNKLVPYEAPTGTTDNQSRTYEDNHDDAWYPVEVSKYQETTLDGFDYFVFGEPDRPLHEKDGWKESTAPDDFPDAELHYCSNPKPPTAPHVNTDQAQGKIVLDHPQDPKNPCAPFRHYVVPDGHIFAMGDNRANSADSRVWGSVPINYIKGKALFIWLSYKELPGDIRWSRMGNFVH